MKYEGTIGYYTFIMNEEDCIEIWTDLVSDRPDEYIMIRPPGSVKSKKDFDLEIMDWYSKNS